MEKNLENIAKSDCENSGVNRIMVPVEKILSYLPTGELEFETAHI